MVCSARLVSESARAAARVVGGGTVVADPALVGGAAWTAAEVLPDPDQGERILGVAARETGGPALAAEDHALAAEAEGCSCGANRGLCPCYSSPTSSDSQQSRFGCRRWTVAKLTNNFRRGIEAGSQQAQQSFWSLALFRSGFFPGSSSLDPCLAACFRCLRIVFVGPAGP